MQLKIQKRLAAKVSKCGQKRIVFDTERLEDIKEAITKVDIKTLINEGAIKEKPIKGVSKFRARKIKVQKRKGRQKNAGSRKGKRTARLPKKEKWMIKIRLQRKFIKELKEKGIIKISTYRMLYGRAKSGFFRNKKHIKQYLDENKLTQKK